MQEKRKVLSKAKERKLNLLRFAAIDIGSNAIRLLFSFVIDKKKPIIRKYSLFRLPVRLGPEVFAEKRISTLSIEALISTMKAFRHLTHAFDLVSFRACATSAMREAANGKDVVKKVLRETGIQIEIISGKEEAELIFANHSAEAINPHGCYYYVDVGGGSTEISIFHDLKIVESRSFNLGTLRYSNGLLKTGEWIVIQDWLGGMRKIHHPEGIIGSGGNVNTLFKISGKKKGKPMSLGHLRSVSKHLEQFEYEELIEHVGLKPDRADVILNAAHLFMSIMKIAESDKLYVPGSGLADGIIRQLYEDYRKNIKRAPAM